MFPLSHLRSEFRPMLRLALPVVIAELGWMGMGVADTLMVGPLGPEAIGAVGVGSSLFTGVVIFGMGLLLGLDTLVSHAYGAGRLDECHKWLLHGIALSVMVSVPVGAILVTMVLLLPRWGLAPSVLVFAQPYLGILTWSLFPLLMYATFRRYLQGMGVVRPVMIALIMANVINIVMNWILIYGHLGAPAMGVRGSAWATVIARIAMAGYLLVVIIVRERRRRPGLFETPLRLEIARMRRLVTLGFPAAAQVTLEVGGFAAATALAGRLAPTSLAAHQIALNIAACAFMVPLGLSSAGAVRVGQAIGRKDLPGAERAGWTALLFGVIFTSVAASLFMLAPRTLIGAFTTDEGVLSIGASLLFVAAVFQLSDGLQGVATGILRGLGDTRTAMVWNLFGHWFIGLPCGYVLCFVLGVGVAGLWWGLSAGLTICGVALVAVWMRRIKTLTMRVARPDPQPASTQ
jgi:MATE family multidrug resistance protein